MTPPSRSEPSAVLSGSSQRIAGEDALAMNLAAAGAVAEVVRTTLGPNGMDKLLVDRSGNVVVTNDGATVVDEVDVSHPAAVAIADVAATQQAQAGDGTTSAVVLAGELLAVAEDLLDEGLHPTTVVEGYRRAARAATEALVSMTRPVGPNDVPTLERVAATALTGKGTQGAREHLAEVVVSAVLAALEEKGRVDDAVVVRTFPGASLDASRFVPGVLLDFDPCHPGMPTEQADASVVVYEGGVEVTEPSADAAATVTDYEEYAAYVARERSELSAAVDRILAIDADVFVAGGGIDERARERLAKAGVTAFYRIDDEDRERIARATGAERVGHLDRLTPTALGGVGRLRQETIRELTYKHKAPSERTMVFEDLPTETVGTVLLRGGTEHALEEAERAVEDAVDVVIAALKDGAILPGAGAPEAEVARTVRRRADEIGGREALAVEAFADAVEVIPRTLVENAGHDVVDGLLALRTRHDDGKRFAGFDPASGEVVDAVEAGVVEPLRVRTTGIASAVDAATSILRIDDVVSAGDLAVAGDEEEE